MLASETTLQQVRTIEDWTPAELLNKTRRESEEGRLVLLLVLSRFEDSSFSVAGAGI